MLLVLIGLLAMRMNTEPVNLVKYQHVSKTEPLIKTVLGADDDFI